MNHRIITFLLVLIPAILIANHVTPEQALSRLNKSSYNRVVSKNSDVSGYSLTSSPDMLYIFSSDEQFIITPSDDCAPALLGYGTTIDKDNIPPAMESFLKSYADQIKWLKQNPLPLKVGGKEYRPIDPLIKTNWNQTAPYNNLTPLDNARRSYTGCVATAMAQILKYHEWPRTHGYGSHSYEWNGKTLSFDFESTTFEWNKMLDVYKYPYSNDEATAVATLMKACGYSVDMDYSASSSGAFSPKVPLALVDYFGYDKGAAYLMREYFEDEEWTEIIYSELEQGNPVYHTGEPGDGNPGHAFICDGYKSDGYFHFNWGWGGTSDGYFLISALEPYTQGAGGFGKNYSHNQDIVVGIRPAIDGTELHLPFYSNGGIEWSTQHNGFVFGYNEDGSIRGYYNKSYRELNVEVGVKLVSDNQEVFYVGEGSLRTFEPRKGASILRPNYPDNLPAGTYKVSPIVRNENSSTWQPIRIPIVENQYITMRKGNNGIITYDGTDPDDVELPIAITSITQRADWNTNEPGLLKVTINNKSAIQEEFKLAFVLRNVQTNETSNPGTWTLQNIYSGQSTRNLNWGTVKVPNGVYTIRAVDVMRGRAYISDPFTVLVGERPNTVKINRDIEDFHVGDTHQFTAEISPATTQFKQLNWTSSDETIATIDENGNCKALSPGTVTITATTINNITNNIIVKVQEGAGIENVNADSNQKIVDVYNLQGIMIRHKVTEAEATTNLPAGTYIVGNRKVIVK